MVFVGDGKGAEALKTFWRRLRPSWAKVEAVAMDMSAAYRQAVSTHLKKAVIVFDHFHVIKLFNDKLSQLRRDLYREATDKQHKAVLKGTRWLLLKNAENLDEEKDEKVRLKEALKLNEPAGGGLLRRRICGGSGSSDGEAIRHDVPGRGDPPRRRRRRGSRSCNRCSQDAGGRTGAVCWRTTT